MANNSKNRMTVYIDRELVKQLKIIATRKDTAYSRIVSDLIRDYIEKNKDLT